MTRCVDQIECVVFLRARSILKLDSMQFDCNTAFLFEIHIIEHLLRHIACSDGAGVFQQTVGKCRFAMIDVRNNAKITKIFHQVRIKSAVAQTALSKQTHKRQRVKSGMHDEEPLFTPLTNKKIAEIAQKSKMREKS